jgi:hypothetical protein
MPVERCDEANQVRSDSGRWQALLDRRAPAGALANSKAAVPRDEPPAIRDRLDHGERSLHLGLHHDAALGLLIAA